MPYRPGPGRPGWKLRVTDMEANDSGYIDAWSLTF
ncbi:proprotein convertase P-domain-containing protein [Actinomadura soli]|nr:proprotein convertase P-domain-containing protein [Actinomadura soli]